MLCSEVAPLGWKTGGHGSSCIRSRVSFLRRVETVAVFFDSQPYPHQLLHAGSLSWPRSSRHTVPALEFAPRYELQAVVAVDALSENLSRFCFW